MEFRGLDVTNPINRIKSGFAAVAVNVRAYNRSMVTIRNVLTAAILSVSNSINNLARLNDTTPAGPPSGFAYIISAGSSLYVNTGVVANGLSGNPVSMVPFRPNTSVQPWMYIGDSAPYPNVNIPSPVSFNCAGMLKVRSDGLTRKMGIAEPQAAPSVTFPGGGNGSSLIFYRYVYRASETGAQSNPSPDSIPGTNAQANPSATAPATNFATQYTFNPSQYEFVNPQIRTKGGVAVGVTTDYVRCHNLGLTIPTGVTIDGIQADLNWVGQNTGTGVITNASLFYLGNPLGTAKSPGIQNQSFSSDSFMGSNSDTWGATLTPAIINDTSFGFGVQITTQSSGGSDRSFINYMTVTVYYSTQNAQINPTLSADPQVDKIDFYRQGGGLANFTYVGTGPNTAGPFIDQLSDLAVAGNQQLEFDNFEPFPSIDLPRSGTLNVSGNVLTRVSGDFFNIRWLPGTIILIGSPSQVAYVALRRPSTTSSWDFTGLVDSTGTSITIPNGTNLQWNIAQPKLAAQPLPYLFGPTDNINFTFGVGDPIRQGTLYWCKGNNLDSAPDTNQMEVTDPSETLVNGAMSNGLGVLFSIKRAWIIQPNFYNALATVTGEQGSTFTLQATGIKRGLFIPRCVAVEGGGRIFFRVDDGISVSVAGGPDISITDETLYPLFSHEGSTPQSVIRNGVTIYPPDDSKPLKQKFSIQNGFLYYTYLGTDSGYHQLVFSILNMCWVFDAYSTPVTAFAPNEGQSIQGILVGCNDGTVRQLASTGTEVPDAILVSPAIGRKGYSHCGAAVIEYQANAPMTLQLVPADVGNGSYGPVSVSLPATTNGPTKYWFRFAPNKWKWAQFRFETNDPKTEIFVDGCVAYIKGWGVDESYIPMPIFGGPQAGGVG